MISERDADALGKLEKWLHARDDKNAITDEQQYEFQIEVRDGSPWLRVWVHLQMAVNGQQAEQTYAIWRRTGDVYLEEHGEIIDDNGPVIRWEEHEAAMLSGDPTGE